MSWLKILVLLCFYSAIPAFSAQLATKYLLNFKPSFKHMFLLVLSSLLALALIGMIFNFTTSSDSHFKHEGAFFPIITLLIVRLILFAKYIKQTETGAIGGKNAIKILALSTIIEVSLFLPIGLALMMFFKILH